MFSRLKQLFMKEEQPRCQVCGYIDSNRDDNRYWVEQDLCNFCFAKEEDRQRYIKKAVKAYAKTLGN